MLFLIILSSVLVIIGVFILLMTKMYTNNIQKHTETPGDFGIPFETVWIATKNNKKLHGWWIPVKNDIAKNASTLILVHGWNRNVGRLLAFIKELHPEGYNLLVFDSRNHGSSDRDEFSSMPKFAEDILASIDFLNNHKQIANDKVGVIGLSIGGAASIYAASRDKRISSIITVGAFAHPASVMRIEIQKRKIPYFPIIWLFFKYVQYKIGLSFEVFAPVNNISKVMADIFLIHGDQDDVVPPEEAHQLKLTGNSEKVKLWMVPGKGHSNCSEDPEFWDQIKSFLSVNNYKQKKAV